MEACKGIQVQAMSIQCINMYIIGTYTVTNNIYMYIHVYDMYINVYVHVYALYVHVYVVRIT